MQHQQREPLNTEPAIPAAPSNRIPRILRLVPQSKRAAALRLLLRTSSRHWRALYSRTVIRQGPGFTMDLVPGDIISDSIVVDGHWEPRITESLLAIGKKGGLMIDVGANLGYFALLWASLSPDNHCIALEPSPRNFEILTSNIKQNGLQSRIAALQSAAGAAPGKLAFDPGPQSQTGWGGFTSSPNDAQAQIDVDVVRIDDLAKTHDTVALLKVDTEGADAWVLAGCSGLLAAGAIEEIWFEQNKPRMAALKIPADRSQEILRAAGYVTQTEGDPGADLVQWRAHRP